MPQNTFTRDLTAATSHMKSGMMQQGQEAREINARIQQGASYGMLNKPESEAFSASGLSFGGIGGDRWAGKQRGKADGRRGALLGTLQEEESAGALGLAGNNLGRQARKKAMGASKQAEAQAAAVAQQSPFSARGIQLKQRFVPPARCLPRFRQRKPGGWNTQ